MSSISRGFGKPKKNGWLSSSNDCASSAIELKPLAPPSGPNGRQGS
jgi:hypothetical protein